MPILTVHHPQPQPIYFVVRFYSTPKSRPQYEVVRSTKYSILNPVTQPTQPRSIQSKSARQISLAPLTKLQPQPSLSKPRQDN
ncbi:hypothetical protein BO94DRAFT_538722 [Aspergillus sclerotioniger CBS 115572]|uniref:Uncharacterized protein n=1 Tax=Aspergillus sclerotioniger CBS 115572 TaxID=1450535 RepID=A0A317VLW9_9EURO|nr:hypothetical protein BO94DRAFT_538722 [Aspergillus sclerotioniger CBS 115572]PWY74559.1 hypothetical protein BO94DRAFT_538722 [Aspergillus sclerotioniger CBS 115572]